MTAEDDAPCCYSWPDRNSVRNHVCIERGEHTEHYCGVCGPSVIPPAASCSHCPPDCASCEPVDCECYAHQDEPDRRFIPPEGWLPFGSLIDYDGPREFSDETGDDGLPLWERPIPPGGPDA